MGAIVPSLYSYIRSIFQNQTFQCLVSSPDDRAVCRRIVGGLKRRKKLREDAGRAVGACGNNDVTAIRLRVEIQKLAGQKDCLPQTFFYQGGKPDTPIKNAEIFG